jgi:RNA polymerase sigma factor (sigma-70 family)
MTTTFLDSAETSRLLQLAESGNCTAVDELFERHLPDVKKSVRRCLRPQARPRFDSSDVIQETHEQARRQLADYLKRRPMPFRLWLLKTAHQRLVDFERTHLQAAKRAVDRELPLLDASSIELAEQVAVSGPSPSDASAQQERARIVRRCLARLDECDREILLRRIFDSHRPQYGNWTMVHRYSRQIRDNRNRDLCEFIVFYTGWQYPELGRLRRQRAFRADRRC